MTRTIAAAVLVLAAAGCADSTGSTQPEDLDDVAAEVQAAAAALLGAPGFEGVAIRLGEERAVTRVDWADWRATNEYRLVSAGVADPGGESSVFGLVQVGGQLYTAQSGPGGNEPWVRLDDEPTSRVPLSLDLEEIAAGGGAPFIADDDAQMTRATGDDGTVRITLTTPHRDDDRMVAVWVIGSDGVLRAHSMRTESGGFIVGADTGYEYSFEPLPDPEPITEPAIGGPLDIAELGAPADLPLVG